ncbi:hypothetical protein BJY04DRAFT_213219 [Aspergillus karnatakaensis]|uniref:HD domain-containing protein n=1 Tax=Aspergillus karnatakaensis TaxID=1810916 RepID=UPI003CCD0F18
MSPSVQESDARSTIDEIFAMLHAQGAADYMGEPVSQLEHCLQSAALAQAASADTETIIASLLHDIGRFIPAAQKVAQFIENGKYLGRASHDILGERFLREVGFSEKVCQLVGSHVVAKRYLCATEEGYWEGLSKTSKRTLEYQGGKFSDDEVRQAEADPWLKEKVAVRRWDDLAKESGAVTPPLEAYREMAVECLLASRKASRV